MNKLIETPCRIYPEMNVLMSKCNMTLQGITEIIFYKLQQGSPLLEIGIYLSCKFTL